MPDRQLMQPGMPLEAHITEKGVLQLLMDVRFLRDTLAGGRPRSQDRDSADDSAQFAVRERGDDFGRLEAQLQASTSAETYQACRYASECHITAATTSPSKPWTSNILAFSSSRDYTAC